MPERKLPRFPADGLRFLRALKRNNKRGWFQQHKPRYEEFVRKPMEDVVAALANDFRRLAPEMVANPKQSVYRIYRDTRFSADKTPYKTHVAAVFPQKGLAKHEAAGFYFHLAPTELLIAGGLYMPAPDGLLALRRHIAENHRELRSIIGSRSFLKAFGSLDGERLKRVPKGFPPDHAAADLLRFKQFLVGRALRPEVATTSKFYPLLLETFRTLLPLVRFLNAPLAEVQRTRARLDSMDSI